MTQRQPLANRVTTWYSHKRVEEYHVHPVSSKSDIDPSSLPSLGKSRMSFKLRRGNEQGRAMSAL